MPLSDEARRIVDEARAAYGPSPEDRARVGAILPLHLAAAVGAAAAASTGSAAAAAPLGFLAGKGALVALTALVVVGGASGGWYWWSRNETRGPRAPSAASATATPAARTTNRGDPPDSRRLPAVKPLLPQTAARANRSRPPLAARAISAKAAISEPGPDVAGEIALLNEAQRALASGQAERALQLLDRHARNFPHGSLAEERAAARILALCALGRVTAARVETAAFIRQFPASPLVERVRASCGK